jgi:hypothetical protein
MIPISSADERVGVMYFMSRCSASLKSREMSSECGIDA